MVQRIQHFSSVASSYLSQFPSSPPQNPLMPGHFSGMDKLCFVLSLFSGESECWPSMKLIVPEDIVSLEASFSGVYFFLNWKIIALRCCAGLCHTTMRISHNYTYICMCVCVCVYMYVCISLPSQASLLPSSGVCFYSIPHTPQGQEVGFGCPRAAGTNDHLLKQQKCFF